MRRREDERRSPAGAGRRLKKRTMDKRTEAQRRESFRQVNVSCAVEDRVMTVEDLALQERVICGQITPEGTVAEVRKEYGLEAPAALGKGAKHRR